MTSSTSKWLTASLRLGSIAAAAATTGATLALDNMTHCYDMAEGVDTFVKFNSNQLASLDNDQVACLEITKRQDNGVWWYDIPPTIYSALAMHEVCATKNILLSDGVALKADITKGSVHPT